MDYKAFLEQQFRANKINHAYLLTGKYADRERVIEFIVNLLAVSREDVLKVTGDTISINEVRGLKRELSFAPFNSPYKIAIIIPADNLATEAQNALLKILEEPAQKALILLFVNDESRILPTIMSRCQKIQLPNTEKFWKDHSIPGELLNGEWNYQERFNLAEELSKDESLGAILDSWVVQIGKLLREEPKKTKYLDLMREIDETRVRLRSNANSRLMLENMLLKF